jgi:hypothetical protein
MALRIREIWGMQYTRRNASGRLCREEVVCPMGHPFRIQCLRAHYVLAQLHQENPSRTPSLQSPLSPLPVA